jgi:hypothetical protein
MSEPLQDQVKRLGDWIADNVPHGIDWVNDQGVIDTAIRLLTENYGPDARAVAVPNTTAAASEADRIADAVREATANPGQTFEVGE